MPNPSSIRTQILDQIVLRLNRTNVMASRSLADFEKWWNESVPGTAFIYVMPGQDVPQGDSDTELTRNMGITLAVVGKFSSGVEDEMEQILKRTRDTFYRDDRFRMILGTATSDLITGISEVSISELEYTDGGAAVTHSWQVFYEFTAGNA